MTLGEYIALITFGVGLITSCLVLLIKLYFEEDE